MHITVTVRATNTKKTKYKKQPAVIEVQRLLGKPMQEKEILDSQILTLEMQLKGLRDKRRKVDKTISCYNNVMSPIRRIPADIFREIFFHCVDNDCDHDLSTTRAPMLLTHVCSFWRSIALSSPLLWARMHITFNCTRPKYDDALSSSDDLMDSSKVESHNQPTSTQDDSKSSHLSRRLLMDLVVEAHRWQNVELTMPVQKYATLAAAIGRMPLGNLATLRVSHHNQGEWDNYLIHPRDIPNSELVTPDLKRYSLHVPPDFITKVASPWATLTHLSLHSYISTLEASKTLAQCFRLVHLKMILVPTVAEWNGNDVLYPPLHLPELRALYVSDQASNILCSFYDSFVVPQLEVLSYHSKSSSSSTPHNVNSVAGGLGHHLQAIHNLTQLVSGPTFQAHVNLAGHVSANPQVHAPAHAANHPSLNPPMHAPANPPGQANQANPLGVNIPTHVPQVNPPVTLTHAPFVNNHRTPPICRLISKADKLWKLSLSTQFFTNAEVSEILCTASSVKHLVYGISTPPTTNQWGRRLPLLYTYYDDDLSDTKWNFRDVFIDTVEPLLTHTSRWTAQGMGYQGLWVSGGMLKTGLKIREKIVKNTQKIPR
ncbi:hypothetical protein JR316_0001674 [Psilocybe cubensis]|uniref:Uncharacterized protein n=1 Tax=Psilocybe cubensis TaxID=181762 RepID=A0ACB8HAR4_PSICU|nr:hypothetical protein JR316_0001674 [Psilocybe cubensis]KAH9484772.1 hypothetical protein JR316_0001674 [Psilocybe cubensis]